MRLLVDADGCPVVGICARIAREKRAELLLFCDTAHEMNVPGATTIVVEKGADRADFALAAALRPGDVAVTQDYGLAAMCLARGARALRQDGLRYTADNIDALLAARHEARRIRRGGGRLRGPRARTRAQDEAFAAALYAALED